MVRGAATGESGPGGSGILENDPPEYSSPRAASGHRRPLSEATQQRETCQILLGNLEWLCGVAYEDVESDLRFRASWALLAGYITDTNRFAKVDELARAQAWSPCVSEERRQSSGAIAQRCQPRNAAKDLFDAELLSECVGTARPK